MHSLEKGVCGFVSTCCLQYSTQVYYFEIIWFRVIKWGLLSRDKGIVLCECEYHGNGLYWQGGYDASREANISISQVFSRN